MARTAKSSISFVFAIGCLAALASPASATTFIKFYNGTGSPTAPTGPFTGAGTVYNDTKSLSTNCPVGSGPPCGSDVLSTTMTFQGASAAGLTASVNNYKVWDDLAPNYGGLGVGTGTSGSDTDDQINGSNILTLTFINKITLVGVATLFDTNHTPFGGSPATDSFLLSIDGGGFFAVTFANANNELLNYTGNVFAFEQKSGNADFYVSALAYNATPIPAALPLFATGLGTLGLVGWRRKRKAAA
jgi:hypothetical protein